MISAASQCCAMRPKQDSPRAGELPLLAYALPADLLRVDEGSGPRAPADARGPTAHYRAQAQHPPDIAQTQTRIESLNEYQRDKEQ